MSSDALLAGPRGRRMLLEYVLLSDEMHHTRDESLLAETVIQASALLDPGQGFVLTIGANEVTTPDVEPDAVASLLAQISLTEVTEICLRTTLARSADAAWYWQEPDGLDAVAGTQPVREELHRFAEHLTRSPLTRWWWDSVDQSRQWSVAWDGINTTSDEGTTAEHGAAADGFPVVEACPTVHGHRPDPSMGVGGIWWSCPSRGRRHSTRELADKSPAGLWFVEDSWGWERSSAQRLHIPSGLRIYEINDATDWADLCREFPREVTEMRRHDWYLTTGRDGCWVIPDWSGVADHFDAVHLTVGAYLSAAGTAISLGDDAASVIAGWNPDEIFWFTEAVSLHDEAVTWTMDTRATPPQWETEKPSSSA